MKGMFQMANNAVQVGVDLGGTKVQSVVLDADMNILAQDTRLSGFGESDVVKNLQDSIAKALSGVEYTTISSIGIGTPGTVDSQAGMVRHSLNLGIESLDLRAAISSEFDCSVLVENDVNATALGLSKIHPELGSLCYLNFGTGLAAGFVINRKIWSGASGMAGEIGHIPLSGMPDSCKCGQQGCLELFSSWSGLRRALPEFENAKLAWDAQDDNDSARLAWESFVNNAVLSIQTVFLTLDPEVIFVGGGVIASGQDAYLRILKSLIDLEAKSPLFAEKKVSSRIRPMPLDIPVAAMGALG